MLRARNYYSIFERPLIITLMMKILFVLMITTDARRSFTIAVKFLVELAATKRFDIPSPMNRICVSLVSTTAAKFS